jgi:lipoprotein-anchoring transpeptidase ErfK/SrfK
MKRLVAVLVTSMFFWFAPAAHAAVIPVEPTPTELVPPAAVLQVEFPVPENSGKGRRVVHSTRQLRVWVINAQEEVLRTFLVSGQRGQPKKGMYTVSSQSVTSFSPELEGVTFRFMTRFAIGRNGGNIGFHEIPKRKGVPMQTVEELGTVRGSGCLRASTEDAKFIFAWAKPGTRIVVVP